MSVINLVWLYIISAIIDCAVLDPALYLSPNPPLMETNSELSAIELWSSPLYKRLQRDTQNLGVSLIENDSSEDLMKPAETIWPLFRNVDYSIRGIHIPLTFSVSGAYGNNEPGVGVISSSYGTIRGSTKGVKSGQTSLAGSGYNGYQSRYPGLRIYTRNNEPAWSGWGNGKWGHYGKG